ncbi:ANTH-domain-containing protein [Exidia glandulosa HHB12029]|uniref:ANTH-domain-containing protein n=1 Tax=Exidia glandulosa HHB12029 TaxID=1314781 RepID=A0A165H6E5_EXIGL|nr:ANTH-domain-containing protein [Exidia glandulosa HHB12029]
MSSFDKVVKLACKPKAAPPKSKYIDPILAATYGDEGTIQELSRALVPRLREPNTIVVFKALLVLHTMMRNGQTDNVLSYLARSDELHLRNIAGGHWDGKALGRYDTPKHMSNYAVYLDTRIKAFRELKHDPVRVQAETNRDIRASAALDEPAPGSSSSRRPASRGHDANEAGVQRSKTVMGRKLRVMTVEKGLLRETKIVQKVIDALLECAFYYDDLEDELVICALRLLVKDLLVLFQACNEGVINVLEHYFEMSKVDAAAALAIYRNFCKQTERVVEYVTVAKKLQNLLNVPVPNLRHAPVSLAGALEEYLNDPNFEQNRIEYKTNKALADENLKSGKSGVVPRSATKAEDKPPPVPATSSAEAASGAPKTMQDLLTAIEEEQPTMFNPRTASPSNAYFQQQAQTGFNPFRQSMLMPQGTGFPGMMPQATGFPGAAPFGMQPTGMSPFPQQQQSPSPFAMQTNPFPTQQTGAPFLQPQQTAVPSFLNSAPQQMQMQMPQQTGMLQPQQTGANPFRQSMLLPQMTGPASFSLSAFGGAAPASATPAGASSMASGAPWQTSSPANVPARPASTPLTSTTGPGTTVSAGGIITHATGSRNPFGAPIQPAPPVPKAPTLQQLATGAFPRASTPPNTNSFSLQNHATGAGAISSVASSFSRSGRPTSPTSPSRLSFASGLPPVPETSAITNSLAGLSFGSSSGGSGSPSALQSQPTGFSGLKPFKPTSSFGASLVDSLPPVSSPSSAGGVSSQPTGFSGFNAQPTGASPFSQGTNGASSASSMTTGSSTASSTPFSSVSGLPSISSATTTGNSSMFSSSFGANGLQPQNTAMPFSNGNGSASKPLQPQMTATPWSTTPFSSGNGSNGTSSPFGTTGALNAQPTGMPTSSTPMLRPQTTGGPNPFRASLFVPGSGAAPMPNLTGLSAPFSSNPNASIQLSGSSPGFQSNNPFPGSQQQQQGQQSLI